jgi:hypothetical protein
MCLYRLPVGRAASSRTRYRAFVLITSSLVQNRDSGDTS